MTFGRHGCPTCGGARPEGAPSTHPSPAQCVAELRGRLAEHESAPAGGFVPWVAFDLDGTLAHHDDAQEPGSIGEVVPEMAAELDRWRGQDVEVRILTARAGPGGYGAHAVEVWAERQFGREIRATGRKDYGLVRLYDDRAIGVEKNRGRPLAARQIEEAMALIEEVTGPGSIPNLASDWPAALTEQQRVRLSRAYDTLQFALARAMGM